MTAGMPLAFVLIDANSQFPDILILPSVAPFKPAHSLFN